MKIAFLGDRHVSQRSPRYQHALDMWDWAITDALGQGATAIIGLGDVCEGTMTGEEAYQLADLYTRVREAGAYACEVLGNHESHDALRWLSFLGVTVADSEFVTVPLPGCIVALAPYARKGRPPYDNLGDGDMTQTNILAAERLTAFVQRTIAAAMGTPVIVAGHWAMQGTKLGDSEYELHMSGEMVVPLSAFDGAALTIGAHIHEAHELTPNIIVAGSLYRASFAEKSDPKSYVLVTVDAGHVTWERRPVPAREMVVVRMPWIHDDNAGALFAIGDHTVKSMAGKEVKLTVHVPEDQLATFDPSVFDPIREAAAHFVLDKQVITSQRVRAPELANATTLAEQFTAWIGATGLDLARMPRLIEKLSEVEG